VGVQTISQRTLRNDNAEILRGVASGESFIITRNRVPIARMAPLGDATAELRPSRPAKGRLDPSSLHRVTSPLATADVIAELRGER